MVPTHSQTWSNLSADLVGPAVAALTNTACHPEHQTGQGLQEEPGERLALKMLCLITFQFIFDEHLRSQLLPACLRFYLIFLFLQHHVPLIEAYRANLHSRVSSRGCNNRSCCNANTKDLNYGSKWRSRTAFRFVGFRRGRTGIHKTRWTTSQNYTGWH